MFLSSLLFPVFLFSFSFCKSSRCFLWGVEVSKTDFTPRPDLFLLILILCRGIIYLGDVTPGSTKSDEVEGLPKRSVIGVEFGDGASLMSKSGFIRSWVYVASLNSGEFGWGSFCWGWWSLASSLKHINLCLSSSGSSSCSGVWSVTSEGKKSVNENETVDEDGFHCFKNLELLSPLWQLFQKQFLLAQLAQIR